MAPMSCTGLKPHFLGKMGTHESCWPRTSSTRTTRRPGRRSQRQASAASLETSRNPVARGAHLRPGSPARESRSRRSQCRIPSDPGQRPHLHGDGIAPGLTENGKLVPLTHAENLGRAKSVVLALDRFALDELESIRRRGHGRARIRRGKAPRRPDRNRRLRLEALQLTRFSSATIDADGGPAYADGRLE